MTLNNPLVRALILIALVFAAYGLMLKAPFKTMDDRFSIVQNDLIRSANNIPEIFKQGYFKDHSYYRPLVNLSFLAEYHAFGLNSFFYNLDNLLLHAANAVLVFMVVRILVGNADLAFAVAIVFAIHPIHWEAVCNIPGRAIIMTAFFELNAFLFFLLFYTRRQLIWLVPSLVFFALALLSKESAGVFPMVIVAYLWAVDDRPLKERVISVLPFFCVIAGYLVLRHHLHMNQVFQTNSPQTYMLGFLTFMRSMITHLRTFILPIDLHFDRGTSFFLSLNDPQAGFTIFFWLIVGVAIIQWRHRIPRFIFFLIAWFAFAMFPVSQLVASIGVQPGMISSADHFLYMASVPVFILAALGINRLREINATRRIASPQVLYAGVGAFLLFLFLTAVEQSIYAAKELPMLERTLHFQPNNARVQASIGLQYVFREDFADAETHFRAAVKADPFNPRYRISLGTSICQQNRWIECLGEYVALDDPTPNPDLDHQKQLALGHVLDDIKAGKDYDAKGWFILGIYYAKIGSVDEAIANFQKAVAKDPNFIVAWINLGSLYDAKQDQNSAHDAYQHILNSPQANDAQKALAQQHLK